jgi:hypothetical protein
MAYSPKPGDGTLFKNKNATSEKAPAYSGDITAHRDIKKGEKVRLAAWLKGGQDGKDKFLSLTMSDDQRAAKPTPEADPF